MKKNQKVRVLNLSVHLGILTVQVFCGNVKLQFDLTVTALQGGTAKFAGWVFIQLLPHASRYESENWHR